MGEKTFSKRIAKTKLDEARDKLSRARSEDMKKYWKGIIDIRLDEYNSLNKGGMPKKKLAKGGAMVAKKKMRGGGMAKMASKKMRGGGVAAKKMRGGGMAKMAKKKMMRGGMAKKK
jgi:hypothetical protein